LFDYIEWNEKTIDDCLTHYEWERACDTDCTWRIGDGTAALYNYIYLKIAGFTEHDTFRSNQIREGQLSRQKALELVMNENQPRYSNIEWYCNVVGVDTSEVIKCIDNEVSLYEKK
jgi:glucosamine--fructose-6-phosphate aminotransferase (isomerizing)